MPAAGPILRSPHLQWLLVQVFPRLRTWPVREWPALLATVRGAEFDRIERLGIVAAVVLVSYLLRPADGADAPLPAFLSQWFFALPLLLLTAGPFFLRRIRRALDEAARASRSSPAVDPERK